MDDEKVIVDDEPRDDGAEMTDEETHRYDEYEGLSRKIDELAGKLGGIFDKLDKIQAGVDGFVEAGAVIDEAGEDAIEETIEDIIEAADAFDAFDDLDFNI